MKRLVSPSLTYVKFSQIPILPGHNQKCRADNIKACSVDLKDAASRVSTIHRSDSRWLIVVGQVISDLVEAVQADGGESVLNVLIWTNKAACVLLYRSPR